MKKSNRRFVLAEASLAEVKKQLNINTLVLVLLVFMLGSNIIHFLSEPRFFYGLLIVIMLLLLFLLSKSRKLLTMRKKALTK